MAAASSMERVQARQLLACWQERHQAVEKWRQSLWTCWQSYLQQQLTTSGACLFHYHLCLPSRLKLAYWWSRAKHVRLDLFIVGGVAVDEMRLWLRRGVSMISISGHMEGVSKNTMSILYHPLFKRGRPAESYQHSVESSLALAAFYLSFLFCIPCSIATISSWWHLHHRHQLNCSHLHRRPPRQRGIHTATCRH